MTYPTTPKFATVGIESVDPTLVSETISGRMQSRKTSAQKWKFTASYPPLTRAEFSPIWAYLVGRRGRHGVFTVIVPELSTTSGTGTGTITTTATAIGLSSVPITGLSGTLKAGDFVKFAGHDKVYALTSDRSGAGNLSITPELVSSVGIESVVYNDVPFTVRMSNDVQSYQVGKGMMFSNEVDFVEAI